MSEIRPAVVEEAPSLTPEWLTAMLRAAGHDVHVRGFLHRPIGTGPMAPRERIELEYAGPGPPDSPASLVGKFASPSPESRASGARGGYRAETRFYTDLAHRLPIRTPRCLYGALSEDESTFTLILEDMAPAVQGDQIAGASAAALEAAARNLAGLHAPLWNAPELDRLDWTTGGAGEEFARYVEMATPAFIERYADRLAPDDREVLSRFAERARRWVALCPKDRTLVHGDYRLDNLLFREDASVSSSRRSTGRRSPSPAAARISPICSGTVSSRRRGASTSRACSPPIARRWRRSASSARSKRSAPTTSTARSRGPS